MSAEFVIVLTTTDRRSDADTFARVLVERKLAACVQILGPIQSAYRWKGKVETAREWLCLIKTRSELYDAVERTITELHGYETPEIVALPIVHGSADYLAWLDDAVKGKRT